MPSPEPAVTPSPLPMPVATRAPAPAPRRLVRARGGMRLPRATRPPPGVATVGPVSPSLQSRRNSGAGPSRPQIAWIGGTGALVLAVVVFLAMGNHEAQSVPPPPEAIVKVDQPLQVEPPAKVVSSLARLC